MNVMSPVTVVDAMLTSSISEPAASETAWVSGAAYALGDMRIRATTHRVYQCVSAHSGVATVPELDLAHWVDYGPTQRWAMFDQAINTQSADVSTITVVLTPGIVSALALLELVGSSVSVVMRDAPGGTVVYNQTISLDGTIIVDGFSYAFEPFVLLDTVVLTDIPPYATGEITITISGIGTVKCGVLATGLTYELGDMSYGASAGIIDYSTKTTDATGRTTITRRAYSKRFDAKLYLTAAAFAKVYQTLARLRSTPVVWIGSAQAQYAPLVVYGWFKDFSIEVSYPTLSVCSLQVEGLI